MEQDLGLSVEAITQHSQRLFSKSEELGQALTDILEKMKNLMENGQSYVDSESSKNFYEQISGFSKSCNKYILGVQKFASFLVDKTVASYEDVDQEILTLQTELKESLSHLEIVNKLGDAVTGVNESADGTIDSSQLDFSKISSTAGDAASGDFIQEGNVHKEYWEGELQLVPREDGTIQIVKDGTVMGYTTEEGVNLPDATDEAVATSTEEMAADLENGTAGVGSIDNTTSTSEASATNADNSSSVPTEEGSTTIEIGGIPVDSKTGRYSTDLGSLASDHETIPFPENAKLIRPGLEVNFDNNRGGFESLVYNSDTNKYDLINKEGNVHASFSVEDMDKYYFKSNYIK